MTICKNCGKEVEESNIRKAYIRNIMEDVCVDCIEEAFELCVDCGEYFLKQDMQKNGEGDYVCDACFEEYSYCDECGKLERNDDMIYVNSTQTYVCQNCFDNYYEKCNDCGEVYRRDEMLYVDGNDYYVCNRCSDNYAYCEGCGNYYHIDNMHYDDYSGWYCDDCWDEANDEILDYHDNCGWDFYKLPEESVDVLYIGHELEIEPKGYSYNKCEAINTAKKYLNCVLEHDGSLNEDGFEIVSQPQSYNYLMEHYDNYRNAFEGIKRAGYISHDSRNCGLHFHFTAPYDYNSPEREEVLSRLWLIVETYKEQFEKISRRNGEFRWCEFLSKNNDNSMLNGIYKMKKVYKNGDRYLVINNQNSKTIELRLFKGTLNIDTFYADLQFAHNLFTLAYNLELPITEIDWAKLTEGAYISRYCEEHNIKSDRKITDNSIKYITLENKIMRLSKNIYNAYNTSIKKYAKNIDYATKEINYDYLTKIKIKHDAMTSIMYNLIDLKNSMGRIRIDECICNIKMILNTEIELDIDKTKMLNKFEKIKQYNKLLQE